MADRASAIIISKRHILLIHRVRARRDFYVFPGGNIEEGETPEQACVREVLEETGLQVSWMAPAFEFVDSGRLAHYFFIQTHPGTMTLGGPEMQKQAPDNRYLLEWVLLERLGSYHLQPSAVRDAISRSLAEDGPIREARDLSLRRDRLQKFLMEIGRQVY
jgi:8-oxo-dGTP pyrophosphatase MutT (NUDIX family)